MKQSTNLNKSKNLNLKLISKNKNMEQHNLHKKAALEHIDYKDITGLSNNINPHARMNSRRRTGFSAKAQRDFARAIKRARFMALMPYIAR